MSRPKGGRSVERHLTLLTLPLYGPNLKWGVSVVFLANAQRCTSPFYAIPYVHARTRTALVIFTRYAVHGMEQDSEIKRLRKRQATTPHRPVKTSRLLEAQRRTLACTRSCCSILYVNAVRVCYENNTFHTGHHHLRIGPYKGSVNSVQNQMPFHAIVQCWTFLLPFGRLISSCLR